MRYLLIILTLLCASCATHRRTTATTTLTANSTQTHSNTTNTTTQANTTHRDTTTMHIHTTTYTARDTIHRTDTIHHDYYITTTRYNQIQSLYNQQLHTTDTTHHDTITTQHTDTIISLSKPNTRTHLQDLSQRFILSICAAIAAAIGYYLTHVFFNRKK